MNIFPSARTVLSTAISLVLFVGGGDTAYRSIIIASAESSFTATVVPPDYVSAFERTIEMPFAIGDRDL